MEFYLKSFTDGKEKLLAICDKSILGKTIPHNDVEIFVSPQFYGGDLYSAFDVLAEIRQATSINVIGKDICELLIKENIAHSDLVIWFDNQEGERIGHVIIIA